MRIEYFVNKKCLLNQQKCIDKCHLKTYNSLVINEEVNKMNRSKKNGDKDKALQSIVFITALLNLVKALIDLVVRLTE